MPAVKMSACDRPREVTGYIIHAWCHVFSRGDFISRRFLSAMSGRYLCREALAIIAAIDADYRLSISFRAADGRLGDF